MDSLSRDRKHLRHLRSTNKVEVHTPIMPLRYDKYRLYLTIVKHNQ